MRPFVSGETKSIGYVCVCVHVCVCVCAHMCVTEGDIDIAYLVVVG